MKPRNNKRYYFLYSLPAFALAMPTIPAFIYLPTIYASNIGLASTGFVLLLARALDVISDPVIGYLSDNKETRFGRRKPWIFIGSIISGISLIFLFNPPDEVTIAFLFTWVISLYLGWTMISVPYIAWGAELSNDYNERSKITGMREALTILGILLAGTIPVLLPTFGYKENTGLTVVVWGTILFGAIGIFALLKNVKETKTLALKDATERKYYKSILTLKNNKPFLRLISAWFLNGLANGIPASLFIIYMEYGLNISKTDQSLLILLYFSFGIISIPVWVKFSNIFGKHKIWSLAMIMTCLAFIFVLFLEAGDVKSFAIICIITGMGFGADMALPPSIQADVIDYDKFKNKTSRAGICFAAWSMSTKLALALAVGISFPLLEYLGFSMGQTNEPSAIRTLSVIYAGLPVVFKLISIGLVWSFPINKERLEIILRRLES